MDDKNFRISGIPNNDEFEIPETPKKKNQRNASMRMISAEDLKNMSPKEIEQIKNMLPPEMLQFMSSAGIDFSQVFNQVEKMVSGMTDDEFSSMMNLMDQANKISGIDFGVSMGDSIEDEIPSDISEMFPTGEQCYLFPDEFGSIECYSSDNLYDEFVARYGTDSTLYLDDNIGIRDFLLNDITAHLNIDGIKNMRFINATNNYILFYMEPKDETKYGYYSAVVKKGEGNFALYVPMYCNTFDIIEDENGEFEDACLFSYEDTPFMFDGDPKDITSFKFLAANLIEFAIKFVLAPKKHVLLSPNAFGEIKNTRASIIGDSQFFPIGKITSNGSINSTLLLKDAELPLDKESYNIFVKFPTVVNSHFLRFLSGIFFDVDFNNCPLLENVELKYTPDGKLYFDLDHLDEF